MAERGSSTLQRVFVGVGVALFLGGLLLFRFAPDPAERESAGEVVSLRKVETQRVHAVPIRSRVQVAGVLEGRRSVQLYAETRGAVTFVGAEALDRVEEGQTLVRVDPLEGEVAVERARAAVARGESELALARSDLARRKSLSNRGVTSAAELEATENAEKVAVAALRQARAELKQAQDDLTKKDIAAPFSGVLRSFQLEAGEYVQPGQEIGELLDLSTARATIGLSDREVVALEPGQPVDLLVEAHSGERFQGRVLRVGAASDPETRKFPVEVEAPNPAGRLLPGMIATVAFDLGGESLRTVIPREATIDEFGLRFVWVLEQEGDELVARRRRVEVRAIPFRPAEFEVLGGLVEGEEIALSAIRQLRQDERVKRNGSAPG